ncbi:hypothetical protein C8F01DRAFT_1119858 [Mycena amicta]|nr:hypothetical protein C8F01DRAFT_1119858 [Mycena amicta]
MTSPAQLSRLETLSPTSRRQISPLSPVTPVTGIVYPSPTEMDTSSQRSTRHPAHASGVPRNYCRNLRSPVDSDTLQADDSLDDLWGVLRRQKELRMQHEKPKVRSLEDHKPTITGSGDTSSPSPQPNFESQDNVRLSILQPLWKLRQRSSPPPPPSIATERRWLIEEFSERDSFFHPPKATTPPPPAATPPPPPTTPPLPTPPSQVNGVKKKKSILSFKVSPEKNYVVAIFDLKQIEKDAIRISHNFEQNEITVSWEVWECETWTQDDCIVRQTVERLYYRVIELAHGVESQDIYAAMKNGDLLWTGSRHQSRTS